MALGNTKSLEQIAYVKPLRKCGIEELAIHQITANPSGGILFARKTEHAEKYAARQAILDMFTADKYPCALSMLTMPGLTWNFEGAMLKQRNADCHGTYFHCIENDRSIYHAALMRMPRIRAKGSLVRMEPARSFAERAVSCQSIRAYWFGEVDALMRSGEEQYMAAWLDYTGPLSIKRLSVIAQFYLENVRDILIVTALRARWNKPTVSSIDSAGGYYEWLKAALPGTVIHTLNYQDGASPMAQIAIAKAA